MAGSKKAKRKLGGGAKKRAKAAETVAANEVADAPKAAETKPAKPAKPAKTKTKPAKTKTKPAKTKTKPAKTKAKRKRKAHPGDPTLFAPLTSGERADALRVLTEDRRLAQLAKVGRYRVITVEPLTVKLSSPAANRRLARIVIYDYASDRCIDACVDLDGSEVVSLRQSRNQPMLSREEEAAAISIALGDDRVKSQLSLGDEAQLAMHYWSNRETELAYTRRSAAVIFGGMGSRPSLVAVVDLLDAEVTNVVPASQW